MVDGRDALVEAPTGPASARARLTSLDVLRGLAVAVMVLVNVPGDRGVHPAALVHVDWEGFRLAELVFPAFVVAAGGAVALSSRAASLRATAVRALRIVAVGEVLVWVKYGSIGFKTGTLQFIAAAWMVAALMSHLRPRWRVVAALVGMAAIAALHLVPGLPGAVGWGPHSIDTSIDTAVFGGRSDLGVLGMVDAGFVGALASVAVGAVRHASSRRRATVFAAIGVTGAAVAAGLVAVGVPVVKRTWSPSYLFLGAGICFVVLALAELVAMRRLGRAGLVPFLALGTNALPLYLLSSIVGLAWTASSRQDVTAWFADRGVDPAWASLGVSVTVLVVVLGVALALRRSGRVIRL